MKKASKRLKIRKSISNRFEVTPRGKVLKMSSFNRHLRRKKSKKQLRRLKGKQPVLGRFATKIKKLLGRK